MATEMDASSPPPPPPSSATCPSFPRSTPESLPPVEVCELCKTNDTSPELVCSNTLDNVHSFCRPCMEDYVMRSLPTSSSRKPNASIACPLLKQQQQQEEDTLHGSPPCDCMAMSMSVIGDVLFHMMQRMTPPGSFEAAMLETSTTPISRKHNEQDKDASTVVRTAMLGNNQTQSELSPNCFSEESQGTAATGSEPTRNCVSLGAEERKGEEKVEKCADEDSSQGKESDTNAKNDEDDFISALDRLVLVVQAVLTLGATGTCPQCGKRTLKEDGTCPRVQCNTECLCLWCYCCGNKRIERYQINEKFCPTCERTAGNDNSEKSWQVIIWDDEEEREFHRCRTLYYLKKVKDSVSPMLWNWLRNKHTTLLQGLGQANGVSSIWDRIDAAHTPQLYGRTTAKIVAWLDDVDEVINNFHKTTSYKFRHLPAGLLDTERISVSTFWTVTCGFLLVNSFLPPGWKALIQECLVRKQFKLG